MKAAGMVDVPGGQGHRSIADARAARRAVAQLVAAKAAGDDRLAAIYAAAAARAIDRHLAELRARRRRLS